MSKDSLRKTLQDTRAFFEKTTACFGEPDADFAPQEGLFTVAQHVAHAAQVVEWFMEGAFRPEGMGTDFQTMHADVLKIVSLADARTWWDDAFEEALETVDEAAPESWSEAIRGPIMAGAPRSAVLQGIVDHTAHHRGALAVYARLRGLEPDMPYD